MTMDDREKTAKDVGLQYVKMQEDQGDKTSTGLSLTTVWISLIQTNEWEYCSQEQDDKEGMLLVNPPKHQGFHWSLENTGKLIGRKPANGKGEVEEYLHDSRVPMTEKQLLYDFRKSFFTSPPREKNYLLDLPVSNTSIDDIRTSHLGQKVLSELKSQKNTTIQRHRLSACRDTINEHSAYPRLPSLLHLFYIFLFFYYLMCRCALSAYMSVYVPLVP